MNSTDKLLAQAIRTRACLTEGYTKGSRIVITAKAYFCGGNEHPHFSVTCAIGTPRQLETGDWQAGGCMHREAVKYWPQIAPIVALHLSNADDGEPMHGAANGWYWLAGALGGAGEEYHGGNSKMQHWKADGSFDGYREPTPAECMRILCEHLRITPEAGETVRAECAALLGKRGPDAVGYKAVGRKARAHFFAWVETQRERWKREAAEGLALLQKLSTEAAT